LAQAASPLLLLLVKQVLARSPHGASVISGEQARKRLPLYFHVLPITKKIISTGGSTGMGKEDRESQSKS